MASTKGIPPFAAAALALACQAAPKPADAPLAHARALLREPTLAAGPNALACAIRNDKAAPGDVDAYGLRAPRAGNTALARLRAGGVGAQFWSVYVPGEGSGFAKTQLEQIDVARRVIARYPDALRTAGTVAEIRAAHR